MIRRTPTLRSAVALTALFALQAANAGELFADQDILEFRLSGPIQALIDDRVDRRRHALQLTVDERAFGIEARVCGKSRAELCEFPPLRLYFPGDETESTVFAGQDRLKLVTHCRNQDRAETNLLEEYTAYRLLNVLTDVSFRVRGVHIHYDDTSGRLAADSRLRYGMLLESRAELAARVGGHKLEVDAVARGQLDENRAALVFVFQYLIGNTDWSLVKGDDDDECCHNIDLIEIDGRVVPVPYDFDLAGLVDAPYAKPDPSLGTRSVRTRRYRGYCVDPAALSGALAHIRSKQDAVATVLLDAPVDERDRERMRSYIAQFYSAAANEDRLLRNFERRCL